VTRPFSLATRTFLLTFLAICVAQLSGFYALDTVLKARIKEGLKANLRKTEYQLDRQETEYNRRAAGLIATLSENPSLKAAIGLSREQSNPTLQAQVRQTIEDQLHDLSRGLDFDFYVVTNPEGGIIASVGNAIDADRAPPVLMHSPGLPALLRTENGFYKVTSVPINLGPENLGQLSVGKRLDLTTVDAYGYSALFDKHGLVASTLPPLTRTAIDAQFLEACAKQDAGCEISVAGENYLALGMDRDWLTPDYHLLRFASIDEAMSGITSGLWRLFVGTGVGGVFLAALFSLLASLSISRPLASLASTLENTGATGALWHDFRTDSAIREVNLLAGALNHAANARREVENDLRNARDAAEGAADQVETSYDDTLQALGAALDLRDNETAGHSHRVTRYCLELAKRMGVSGEQLKHIERGAYLHDIGKIGTPDAILLKPGKLDSEERHIMQQHARVGYELVSQIEFLQEAAKIVYTHQERYDGKGYPQGLAGNDIPLGARIFAVADTLDAMTSDRPYRKALPLSAAMEEIRRESGSQFDPDVVRVLCTIPTIVWDGIRHQIAGLGGSVASKRAPLRTCVVCLSQERQFEATSMNISESGMLMETSVPVTIGEELDLEFRIPEVSEALTPRVLVVRKEQRGIGVRFITLTLGAREGIRRYTASPVNPVLSS
jgi:putative nucleotidyltransferase with HDIG domain